MPDLSDSDFLGAQPSSSTSAPAPTVSNAPTIAPTDIPANTAYLKDGDPGPGLGTGYVTPSGAVYWDPQGKPHSITGADDGLSDKDFLDDDKNAAPAVAPPPSATIGSVSGQALRGGVDTGLAVANQVSDVAAPNPGGVLGYINDATDNIAKLIGEATGPANQPTPQIENPAITAESDLFGSRIQIPQQSSAWLDQQPQNGAERDARTAGQYASGALIGDPEAAAPAVIARNFASGAGAGLVSQVATDATPDSLKPFVGPAAAVAATVLTHGALKVPQMAADAAAPFVAGSRLPIVPQIGDLVAEKQAGQRILNAASDPAAVRASVPSAAPNQTLAQATGDRGVMALDAKRSGTLRSMQTGGDPSEVSSFLSSQLASIDAAAEAKVGAAKQVAQDAAAQIGGDQAPEVYGSTLRGHVSDAETAARQKEGALWQAVDPDGTLTGNATSTAQAAKTIASTVPGTAKPMDGEEAAIFQTVQGLKPVTPLSDLIALRSRVSTAMRDEVATSGRTPAYARLSQLRGAIEDNLGSTISDAVNTQAQQVAAGTIAPEDTIAARMQAGLESDRQSFYQQRQAATGTGAGAGVVGNAGGGSPPVSGPGGAKVPAGRGSRNASGNPSLPIVPQVGDQPSIDTGAAQRLAAASDATKARAQTFGASPVVDATRSAGAADLYRLPDGSVPSKFFHSGPTGFNDVQSLLTAAPNAAPVLADYAALSLKRAALTNDGIIDPAKFAKWRAQNQDALRALPPDVQARFADAATAGQSVADAGLARTQALKSAQAGAVGKLVGATEPEDATKAVGGVLTGRTAVADMKGLAGRARRDPAAWQGLRQATADTLAPYVQNGNLGDYVSKNRAALSQVFTPDEMSNLNYIAGQTGKPGLAGKVAAAAHGSPLTVMGTILGGVIGEHIPGLEAIPGAGEVFGAVTTHYGQALHAAGVAKIDDLIDQALLNPTVAQRLFARVPAGAKPTARQAAMRGLVGALAGVNSSYASPSKGPQVPQR